MLNTTRQVSGAIGLALLTTLVDARASGGAGHLASGYDLAFLVGAATAAVAALGALTLLPTR